MTTIWFAKKLLAWYAEHGRQDLPWKKPCTAYRVWLSEIMLQQTQVSTVIPYFHKFIQRFPTIERLAASPLDEVLAYWAGLGYYARARNLHKAAQFIVRDLHGNFPQTVEALMALPGIGRSTAGAILAQAFNIRAPILDGNVKRVLWRFHCHDIPATLKEAHDYLWQFAENYTPKQDVNHYTQAIMDLGATLCTRTQPKCEYCPVQSRCSAYQHQCQTAFPPKQTKKKLPTQQVHLLCLVNPQQEILLEKRPLKGIWGGLYSLPEFSTLTEAKGFLKQHYKTLPSLTSLASLQHTFTHFHLHIESSLVQLKTISASLAKSHWRWTPLSDLQEIGLPAPIKKLLKNVTIQSLAPLT